MTTDDLTSELPDEPVLEDLDEVLDEVDDPVAVTEEVAEIEETEDGDADAEPALDELEAEELEMLTEDETSESILVDETQELLAIRRAELAMEGETPDGASEDEFVCSSCFLVLKISQLADRKKMICRDCAA